MTRITVTDFTQHVRDGLNELRRRDRDGTLGFGAGSHRYLLHPAVPGKAIEAFERKHAISLPPDYRAFLAQLGNGGAGPYYGVFKLGEIDDNFGFKPWEPGGLVGALADGFPHVTRWNLSQEELERIQASEDDDEILRTYWVPVDGAIPICHEGCALRDWLVVTGAEAGNVWHDAMADLNGWSPRDFADGRHMTFADWYLSWLDEALRTVT